MSAEKRTCTLYNGEVVIDFYPESHRYKLKGEKNYLISASSAAGIVDKSRFLIPWALNLAAAHLRQYFENSSSTTYTAEELLPLIDEAIKQHTIKKEEAASIGSIVHGFAEEYARFRLCIGPEPQISEEWDERATTGVSGFLDWFNAHEVKFIETERLLYSRQHGYVGITDVVASVDGKKYLMDYKTSKGIYNEQFYQLSAYWGAYEEEMGEQLDGGAILHFDKESGAFTFKEVSREEHEKNFRTFLACFAIKQREKELSI